MDLVDIFPATIAVTELDSLTPELIAKAKELIAHGDLIKDMESDGAYTREQNLLDKVIFREVKEEILKNCMQLAQAYSHRVTKMEICNSWGNIIGLGQSIRFHRHVNSYLSGSFYLSEGSAFTFHNFLGENLFSMMPEKNDDPDNFRGQTSFIIKPKPGRLILFPSGLHHSVQNSEDSQTRYSIAFNTVPIGKIGTPTNLMQLHSH
ncbi:2OG-Fe(II) oxygenase family protein [Gammaproteobacteria bacterium]|nr:2OG-Fe(II) oxygenase family protein [Gammaproteobacteria bacterium]